jgi:pyruvate dehydrogenase E2 component (dihydrolipoamide acetyltransferase)
MATDVIMPALGMAQDTGVVLKWLKSEGESVAKGEPLMEVETDKATVVVDAPADGTLAAVRAAEGDEIPVGEVIALLLAAGESVPASETEPRVVREVEAVVAAGARVAAGNGAAAAAAPPARRKLASPKARRLARELGVDIDALSGSGPNGAVVAADVEARATAAEVAASNRLLLAEAAAPLEVSPVWRRMAERTTESWRTVPHFYLRREVVATRLRSWRDVARAKPGGEAVSVTDLLVRIVAEALVRHPRVNGSWRDGTIVAGDAVNVGLAVATADGLVVPVIHGADRLDLATIAARRQELVARAQEKRLTPDDVTGATFTISNLGTFGVDSFDAIVNAPQAAILAVGRIHDRVVPVDGQPAVRPVLELSVSFDHRVVDGARGAEFLETLASLVEEPAGLVS